MVSSLLPVAIFPIRKCPRFFNFLSPELSKEEFYWKSKHILHAWFRTYETGNKLLFFALCLLDCATFCFIIKLTTADWSFPYAIPLSVFKSHIVLLHIHCSTHLTAAWHYVLYSYYFCSCQNVFTTGFGHVNTQIQSESDYKSTWMMQ